jgi:hypothetical protein
LITRRSLVVSWFNGLSGHVQVHWWASVCMCTNGHRCTCAGMVMCMCRNGHVHVHG